jgi:hypothetical protein
VPDSTFRTGGNRRCGNIFRADPFETHVYDAEDVSFTQDYAEPLVEETRATDLMEILLKSAPHPAVGRGLWEAAPGASTLRQLASSV